MTNNWTPSEGTVVDGRYEVTGFLGEGGIAQVWQATDQRTGDEVALKHINFDSDNYRRNPSKMEELFQREVEALRKIKNAGGHPNIIELYDVTSVQGTQVAVVETVEGKELDEDGVSLPPNQIADVARQIADAIAYLHRNEVILRDLKPDNAMLRSDNTPVLIDFNTAKDLEDNDDDDRQGPPTCPSCGEELDMSHVVCQNCGRNLQGGAVDTKLGADIYKPPEVSDNMAHLRQGPWSDVYSLGKILFYLLADSNAVPHEDGLNPKDFPPIDIQPSNEYLCDIVERATAANYGERYNNARVFATVIQNQDPEPPTTARLIHDQTGNEYEISPGDTIGRQGADGPAATITIDDPGGNHISAVQVQFDTDQRGNWLIRDESLNGTYVNSGGGWQRVLCERGRERLRDRGHDPTDRHGNIPPTELRIEDGAIIKLVDTTYDVTFQFEEVG